MANRIRGITVEIGGDTTRLDKALKGTNKQLSSTQSSLRDVERLLKMDPGNVTLLEQRQRLLSSAVETTSEKFRTLQQAVDGADAALDRGQAYEEKYAPLKASLEDVGGKLEKLKAKQDKMDESFATGTLSGEKYQEFNQTLLSTQEEYDRLIQAQKDLQKEFDGAKLNQEQYDALQREFIETSKNMEDLKKQAHSAGVALESFAGKAEEVAKKADKAAKATKGISTVAAGVAVGIGAMAVKAAAATDDLNTLSKQSGFSTDTIQQWQYAADRIDVSAEDIISSARKMEKNMISSSADVQAAWQRIGVSVTDSSGQLRGAENVFNDVLVGLSLIPNEVERDTVAMTLFGKSANDLAGIVDDGGTALRQLGQEAKDAGLILSQDALDGANAFNDEMDKLKAQAKAAFFSSGAQLAESLIPFISKVVEALGNVLEFLSKLDPRVLKSVSIIAMMVAAISPIAGLIASVTSAISGVSNVAKLFNATAGNATYLTFAKWAIIIMAVVAAVAALIAMINVLMGKGKETSSALSGLGGAIGGGGGLPTGGGASGIHGFATGGVFAPNNPMLGILGDNRTEYEVAAPESMLRETFLDALAQSGLSSGAGQTGVGPYTFNFIMDGQRFARMFVPYLRAENIRLGVDILNR